LDKLELLVRGCLRGQGGDGERLEGSSELWGYCAIVAILHRRQVRGGHERSERNEGLLVELMCDLRSSSLRYNRPSLLPSFSPPVLRSSQPALDWDSILLVSRFLDGEVEDARRRGDDGDHHLSAWFRVLEGLARTLRRGRNRWEVGRRWMAGRERSSVLRSPSAGENERMERRRPRHQLAPAASTGVGSVGRLEKGK